VTSFAVLDPGVHFSDHLPLIATVSCTNDNSSGNQITSSASTQHLQVRPNETATCDGIMQILYLIIIVAKIRFNAY